MKDEITDLFDGEDAVGEIEVFSMFRNNAAYLPYFAETTRAMERMYPKTRFVYRIAENDSNDGTRALLREFAEDRPGRVRLHLDTPLEEEYVNKPSGKNYTRLHVLSKLRNRLVARARPIGCKWCLFVESNIFFEPNVLRLLFAQQPALHRTGLLCPYTQQLFMPEVHPFVKRTALLGHFYDTFSLFNASNQSYWPQCGFARCGFCARTEYVDRTPIPEDREGLTEVGCAFGGFALIRADVLNDPTCVWATFNHNMRDDEGTCEHVAFCHALRTNHRLKVHVAQGVDRVYRTL